VTSWLAVGGFQVLAVVGFQLLAVVGFQLLAVVGFQLLAVVGAFTTCINACAGCTCTSRPQI
jgi:hypothetical protein